MISLLESSSLDGGVGSAANAREWALLIRQRALAPEERSSFESWLENPEHEAEFVLAFEIICRFDDKAEVNGSRIEPTEEVPRQLLLNKITSPLKPRRFLLAAGVILVVGAAWLMSPHHPGYSTGVGERLTTSLPDGTQVVLNSQTDLRWLGGQCDRRVQLISGEAWFDVQHRDARCPFKVVVDRGTIDVLGTQFDVYRHRDSSFYVSVLEGRVSVHGPGIVASLDLAAGQQATWREGSQPSVQPFGEPAKIGSWRQGRIDFDNEPLANVVEELQRYTQAPIKIADPRLLTIHVTGEMLIDPPHIRESIRRLAGPQIVVGDDGTSFTLTQNTRASGGLQQQ